MIKKSIVLTVLVVVVSVLTIAFTNAKKDNKQTQKPNIIYILADDLGYGDLSCFNNESKINTPNLDKLASEGMRFSDAHTSSSVCTPTRYGILTGRYNWRSTLKKGVINGYAPALIDSERETVASLLKKSGYNTAYIGKWHLGWNWEKKGKMNVDFSKPVTNGPNTKGFDYAFGHCGSLDMPPYVYVENGMPTAIPVDITEGKKPNGFWRKGLTSPDFVHEEVTPNVFNRGMDYIKQQSKTGEPFFLYLPLPSPHSPILPTKEWQGKSGLNPYGDFVMMIDDYIGQLMNTIKEAGVEDNTLVIFTSDNGCSKVADIKTLQSKGHYPSYIYRGAKSDIFEGGHRVPFIVRWPDNINKGTVCDQTICTTDLMATCASIVKHSLKDNEAEDSYNMMPLFSDPKTTDFKREATVHHSIQGKFAIRKGDWKFILCPGSGGWSKPNRKSDDFNKLPPYQLYNLKNNPGETDNLYGKYPEIEQELKQLLISYINKGRSTEGAPQENDFVKKWPQINWTKNK